MARAEQGEDVMEKHVVWPGLNKGEDVMKKTCWTQHTERWIQQPLDSQPDIMNGVGNKVMFRLNI